MNIESLIASVVSARKVEGPLPVGTFTNVGLVLRALALTCRCERAVKWALTVDCAAALRIELHKLGFVLDGEYEDHEQWEENFRLEEDGRVYGVAIGNWGLDALRVFAFAIERPTALAS